MGDPERAQHVAKQKPHRKGRASGQTKAPPQGQGKEAMGQALAGLQQPVPFVVHTMAGGALQGSPGEMPDRCNVSAMGANNRAPGAITRGTRVGCDGLKSHG